MGVVALAISSLCKEGEEMALHFICSCVASSHHRYLGNVFFNEKSAQSLLLENDSEKPRNVAGGNSSGLGIKKKPFTGFTIIS